METVGRHLRVPKSEVYGAATSYTELTLEAPARHTLRVCTGLSCSIRGAGELLDGVRDALGAPDGGDTAVVETACGFLCGVAPAVQWDGRWVGRATVESVCGLVAAAGGE